MNKTLKQKVNVKTPIIKGIINYLNQNLKIEISLTMQREKVKQYFRPRINSGDKQIKYLKTLPDTKTI